MTSTKVARTRTQTVKRSTDWDPDTAPIFTKVGRENVPLVRKSDGVDAFINLGLDRRAAEYRWHRACITGAVRYVKLHAHAWAVLAPDLDDLLQQLARELQDERSA